MGRRKRVDEIRESRKSIKQTKREEYKERLSRFAKETRRFIARTPSERIAIQTASLDIAKMIAEIPEEDMPIFREVMQELLDDLDWEEVRKEILGSEINAQNIIIDDSTKINKNKGGKKK